MSRCVLPSKKCALGFYFKLILNYRSTLGMVLGRRGASVTFTMMWCKRFCVNLFFFFCLWSLHYVTTCRLQQSLCSPEVSLLARPRLPANYMTSCPTSPILLPTPYILLPFAWTASCVLTLPPSASLTVWHIGNCEFLLPIWLGVCTHWEPLLQNWGGRRQAEQGMHILETRHWRYVEVSVTYYAEFNNNHNSKKIGLRVCFVAVYL